MVATSSRSATLRCTAASVTLLAAVCSAPAHTQTPSAVDDTHREVKLVAPATRVVSLAPHLAELMFEIGAGAQLVGTAAHSDFPPQAAAVARIGDARALDLEAIAALRPDLILGWHSGNPPRLLERLRAMGFAVFVSEPRRLEDVATTLERLGTLAGTQPMANERAARFRARLDAIRGAYRSLPRVSVFYQVWHRPLITINGRHIVSDALAVCGAVNVFADHAVLIPRPELETVVGIDPQAIVGGDVVDGFAAWRRWPSLRAVRNDSLVAVAADTLHRPTSRILDAVSMLCNQLDNVRVKTPPG